MRDRPARVSDVHEIAAAMPHVKRIEGPKGNAVYQVGGKSFVFFRTPQPDAKDPETGERYPDVIMIWVESESDKLALQDPDSPFFTTDRFDGHPSVLVRASELRAIGKTELTELIQDAWLSRASKRADAVNVARRSRLGRRSAEYRGAACCSKRRAPRRSRP